MDGQVMRGVPPTPLLNTFDDAEEEARQQQEQHGEEERQGLMPQGGNGNADEDDDDDDALEGGDDELLGTAGGGINGEGEEDILELGGWVEANPLYVQPTMPLEVVMDLFKKMGPRVILISKHGQLQGLVTVKDLLKVIATQERAEMLAHEAARDARMSQPGSLPINSNAQRVNTMRGMRAASLHEFGVGDFGGELELLLKDGWQWTKARTEKIGVMLKPILGRFSPSGGGNARQRPIYSNIDSAMGSSSAREDAGDGETSYFVLEGDETEEDAAGRGAEQISGTPSK